MGWLIASKGNDSPTPDAAEAVYDPAINYTGIVLLLCGQRLRVELIAKNMPEGWNWAAFVHDQLIGKNWDEKYVDNCDKTFLALMRKWNAAQTGDIKYLRLLDTGALALYSVAHGWDLGRVALAKCWMNWS